MSHNFLFRASFTLGPTETARLMISGITDVMPPYVAGVDGLHVGHDEPKVRVQSTSETPCLIFDGNVLRGFAHREDLSRPAPGHTTYLRRFPVENCWRLSLASLWVGDDFTTPAIPIGNIECLSRRH